MIPAEEDRFMTDMKATRWAVGRKGSGERLVAGSA
jgi:hypothetical protein